MTQHSEIRIGLDYELVLASARKFRASFPKPSRAAIEEWANHTQRHLLSDDRRLPLPVMVDIHTAKTPEKVSLVMTARAHGTTVGGLRYQLRQRSPNPSSARA